MLNDVNLNTLDKATVDGIVTKTKNVFMENVPYKLYDSALSRTDKIVVFNKHFISVFRLLLSQPDGGCIIQMSPEEKAVYYAYVDYQNAVVITDPEMLLVVQTLDNCIVNEVECKVATYTQQCFDVVQEWETCPVNPTSALTMTQAEYNLLPYVGSSTTYVITLNGVTVKIYVGSVVIWTL
jgi:hypothetical protein